MTKNKVTVSSAAILARRDAAQSIIQHLTADAERLSVFAFSGDEVAAAELGNTNDRIAATKADLAALEAAYRGARKIEAEIELETARASRAGHLETARDLIASVYDKADRIDALTDEFLSLEEDIRSTEKAVETHLVRAGCLAGRLVHEHHPRATSFGARFGKSGHLARLNIERANTFERFQIKPVGTAVRETFQRFIDEDWSF